MRQAGNIDKATILQGPDGKSKGCGIVTYQHPKDAQRAIRQLTDSMLDGRNIFVREDRGQSNGASASSSSSSKGLSVFVGNLSYETRWQDLKDHMRQAGNVDSAVIFEAPDGRSKGCGIVVYQHPKDAQRALRQMQDTTLHGRPIFVREDKEER
jgi:RNA recognition motif-containing protein